MRVPPPARQVLVTYNSKLNNSLTVNHDMKRLLLGDAIDHDAQLRPLLHHVPDAASVYGPYRCQAVFGNGPSAAAWLSVELPSGLSGSRCVLIPLGDQPPGGLDDVAAEQCGRHVGVLGEPPGGRMSACTTASASTSRPRPPGSARSSACRQISVSMSSEVFTPSSIQFADPRFGFRGRGEGAASERDSTEFSRNIAVQFVNRATAPAPAWPAAGRLCQTSFAISPHSIS
jgi:hypothetical protein